MSRYGVNYSCAPNSEDINLRPRPMFCTCGVELPLKTSWTLNNPGRRFRACPSYGTPAYCGAFQWWDPEMCSRSKQIIPGLKKEIADLKDDNVTLVKSLRDLEDEVRKKDEIVKRITASTEFGQEIEKKGCFSLFLDLFWCWF